MDIGTEERPLNHSKHINYWRRSLKTFLPHHYTGNDSIRMTLAFFILSAADILGDLQRALSAEERQGFIEWVYLCQLPEGGFRPSPGTNFGSQRNDKNAVWDPAHIPGTFFALLVLALLGDDLSRVKRKEILIWLNKMQKADGGFGETIGENGNVEGGNDSRFGFMATGIRWILRGNVEGPVDDVPDIDVDKLVRYIQISETYDGGISEEPFHEAHAGFASCAISALQLVDRLPTPAGQPPDSRIRGVTNLPMTLHWLASRQTLVLDEDDALDALGNDANSSAAFDSDLSKSGEKSVQQLESHVELQWVGLNGRCNKIGDTCYAYWACAPLKVLGHLDIVDTKPIRRWLLDKTQHMVGGFGKLPGDPPDIYHSYLGLVTLAIFGEPGLQDVDAALCVSNRVKTHLESLPWRRALVEAQ